MDFGQHWSVKQRPSEILENWRTERAYRVGVKLSLSVVVLAFISTFFDFFWGSRELLPADAAVLLGSFFSYYKSKDSPRSFVWWPLYFGFLTAEIITLWFTGGVRSPTWGVDFLGLCIGGFTFQTRFRPTQVITFLVVVFSAVMLLQSLYHKSFENLSVTYQIGMTGLVLIGILICLYQLSKTEELLAEDFAKHYEELKLTKEELSREEQANFAKTTFLANVSHELRTPLGAVVGFVDLLLNPKTSPSDQLRFTETIKRNSLQLARLVDDLLDLSRLEAGTANIEKSVFSIRDVLTEIQTTFSTRASEKKLAFEISYENKIPEILSSDPLRIKQILSNIIGNAIKFTEHGKVSVALKFREENQSLDILVIDTGRGLQNSELGKLFKPFSQADPSLDRKYGGTGLGLNLSKKLAEALGGDLYLLYSSPGVGTSFVLSLPIDINMNQTWSSEFTHTALVPKIENNFIDDDPIFKNVRILVIDDALDNIELLRLMLAPTGAHLETTLDVFEGIKKALAQPFDIIIMDIQMPLLNGYEAVSLLRNKGYEKPIIAFTAHAMEKDKIQTLRSGFNDHVTKPLNAKVLRATISKNLRQQPQQPEYIQQQLFI